MKKWSAIFNNSPDIADMIYSLLPNFKVGMALLNIEYNPPNAPAIPVTKVVAWSRKFLSK